MNNKKQPTEHNESTEENLVEDLKKSLKDTVDETKGILDTLEQTVQTTIKDQSISNETKKIVDFISNEIKNSLAEESKKIINTIELSKGINNLEEE
jgi:hypothetical protein